LVVAELKIKQKNDYQGVEQSTLFKYHNIFRDKE